MLYSGFKGTPGVDRARLTGLLVCPPRSLTVLLDPLRLVRLSQQFSKGFGVGSALGTEETTLGDSPEGSSSIIVIPGADWRASF